MAKKGKSGGSPSSPAKSYSNDKGPAGNTASSNSPFAPSGANHPAVAAMQSGGGGGVKSAGNVLSKSELADLSKGGKNPLAIMAKALDKGIGLGAGVVNAYNKPGGLGVYPYQGTPDSLDPLRGLALGRGTAYYGASTYTTPAGNMPDGQRWSGTTTYNPIVLPRGGYGGSAAGAGGSAGGSSGGGAGGSGGAGGGGGNGRGGGRGTMNYINQQFDAYKEWAQNTIDTLTTGQDTLNQQIIDLQARNDQNVANIVSTFNDQIAASQTSADEQIASLQNLMMQQDQQFQQASQAQQQQAAAAQAAYEEQRRQAEALARAYVPSMEPTVSNLTYGSNKRVQSQEDTNLLSSLSMLTPTSSVSPALAGLQIA